MFLHPTNKGEIRALINKLPNKHSSGFDDISNYLLKKICSEILTPLELIFNNSLTTGKFPIDMKKADVVPLYKNKSRDQMTNYRPISLLLTISKFLEKVVYKRTYKFLKKHKRIYRSQYGFRSNHLCEQAIGELLCEIIKGREQNKETIAVFLDLSKVFDTLDHNLLLAKLSKYDIRGQSLDWFASYMSNRSIRTKCSTQDGIQYSEYYNIEFGMPQGSCLGPLLVLIFTNDLHLHLENCSCIMFADDTTLYITHNKQNYMGWCIQEDLKILQDWFKANKLTLNLTKSVCMNFSKRKTHLQT